MRYPHDDPPLFLTPSMIRDVLGAGWSTRRVKRWLQRAGVIEKRHGVWVTTIERIQAEFPEIFRRINDTDDNE